MRQKRHRLNSTYYPYMTFSEKCTYLFAIILKMCCFNTRKKDCNRSFI